MPSQKIFHYDSTRLPMHSIDEKGTIDIHYPFHGDIRLLSLLRQRHIIYCESLIPFIQKYVNDIVKRLYNWTFFDSDSDSDSDSDNIQYTCDDNGIHVRIPAKVLTLFGIGKSQSHTKGFIENIKEEIMLELKNLTLNDLKAYLESLLSFRRRDEFIVAGKPAIQVAMYKNNKDRDEMQQLAVKMFLAGKRVDPNTFDALNPGCIRIVLKGRLIKKICVSFFRTGTCYIPNCPFIHAWNPIKDYVVDNFHNIMKDGNNMGNIADDDICSFDLSILPPRCNKSGIRNCHHQYLHARDWMFFIPS